MKKLLVLGALLSTALISRMNAGTITLYDTPYDGNLPGGEFHAVTSDNGSFYTFCLEYSEEFYPSHPYLYSISNSAKQGGGNHDAVAKSLHYDVISQGTAYLYALFHYDELSGYYANHDVNAGYLQRAFWALEDEQSFSWAGGNSNPYLALVDSYFGSFANAQKDYTGTAVQVMNITLDPSHPDHLNGIYRQDQLVYVPDGGATLALLGMALAGLALFHRRVTKTRRGLAV